MCKKMIEKEYLSSEEFVQMMNGDATEVWTTKKKTKKEKAE